ncbi:hypothetical protein [Paenibacillus ihumii]|uniref:hypothetical protein n=1 Tax=Paenibacillus ihumii TaxID=687436 RepID=UPI001651E8E7|nr:hypothetical protein [Paenibacillus ihumii]
MTAFTPNKKCKNNGCSVIHFWNLLDYNEEGKNVLVEENQNTPCQFTRNKGNPFGKYSTAYYESIAHAVRQHGLP